MNAFKEEETKFFWLRGSFLKRDVQTSDSLCKMPKTGVE